MPRTTTTNGMCTTVMHATTPSSTISWMLWRRCNDATNATTNATTYAYASTKTVSLSSSNGWNASTSTICWLLWWWYGTSTNAPPTYATPRWSWMPMPTTTTTTRMWWTAIMHATYATTLTGLLWKVKCVHNMMKKLNTKKTV